MPCMSTSRAEAAPRAIEHERIGVDRESGRQSPLQCAQRHHPRTRHRANSQGENPYPDDLRFRPSSLKPSQGLQVVNWLFKGTASNAEEEIAAKSSELTGGPALIAPAKRIRTNLPCGGIPFG